MRTMNQFDLNSENGQKHWLKSYSLKPAIVLAIGIFWTAFFLVMSHFEIDSYLDAKIADPINFRVRDLLGRSPTQDSRLKVFAIDDKTFAMLGVPMPSLELWADIFDAVAEKKPRLIIVDAMFSAGSNEMNTRTKEIFRRIKQAGIRIATGAFVSRDELKFKTRLERTGRQYMVESYFPSKTTSPMLDGLRLNQMPTWKNRSGWFAYGPTGRLQDVFSDAGHFQLFDENKMEPFLWMGEKEVIPHLAMYAAEDIKFNEQKIVVNGLSIALDRHGASPVNFIPRGKMTIRSMEQLIKDAQAGYSAQKVNAGDVVVILPLYFTGNVDLRPSPYGWAPGGHYLLAMVNSVLTGQWLQPVLAAEVLIVTFTGLGVAVAYMLSASTFWYLWTLAASMIFVLAQTLFTFGGLVVPYVLPLIAGTIAGSHVFALKVRSYERKAMVLRSALDGAVSPKQMENLLRHPDQVSLEPRERVLTLMFIDVVGFSLSSENMLPRMAFDNLKSILSLMAEIIHAHGGAIDKTLGDGLLCYFGYRLDTDQTDPDHPENAVRCAIQIQSRILDESLKSMKSGAPIYPLRIGINTASCYLGDLGSGRRIDFTVVGNGVNFAKRLEAACDTFSVMIGATTYDLIKGIDLGRNNMTRKLIKIKHHAELIDAYDLKALTDREIEVATVMEAYRRESSIKRVNERIPINDPDIILVTTQFGPAEITNFSGSGVSIVMKNHLSRGAVVQVSFESRTPGLAKGLAKHGMKTIEGEVRWSYALPASVAHGLLFTGLTEEQQKTFAELMSQFAFATTTIDKGGDIFDADKAS